MANEPLAPVVDFLRRLVPPPSAAEADGPLLQRYVRERDAAAFTALLQRFGPLVLGVCRRVLTDPHDAEDAFQATFLVFVRKADAITRRDSVGSWLYSVAYRVAQKARAERARRRERARALVDVAAAEPDQDILWRELGPVLDEEIQRLPARYRSPFVLCYLEGKSTEEAGRLLGCARGTVCSRLAWARARLRARLTRRDLAPSAGLLGPVLAEHAVVPVPAPLADATVNAVQSFAAAGAASPPVVLAKGVLRTMHLTRLKTVLAVLLATGVLGTGAGWLAHRAQAQKTPPPDAQASPATKASQKTPAEKPKPETTPLTVAGTATDADGKPVPNATIYLVSTNAIDKTLGQTSTDEKGRYQFVDAPLPVQVSQEPGSLPTGTFQVYGTAGGHGFAWHGMRFYVPRPRPDNRNTNGSDHTIYLNESLETNLTFGPRTRLRGRIRDEEGKPVAGVKVRVHSCDYLETAGKEDHVNFREFWSLFQAPPAMTTVQTDAQGRFQLAGLPREVVVWVHVRHPRYAALGLYAATTAKPLPEEIPLVSHYKDEARPPIATGDLDLTLAVPRRIVVRTVDAVTGKALPGIRIHAGTGMSTGSSSYGTTDAAGRIELKLPPGDYLLFADPPRNDDHIRTRERLTVTSEQAAQDKEVRVQSGCVVLFEAVEAGSGKGVRGATFQQQKEDGGYPVQSSTVYVDNPRTDAAGRMRAVLSPGTGRFLVHPPPGYEAVDRDSGEVNLPAGKTVTVRFTLRKQ
jgi:RNA polymerase sigma factor (sigma-70 family)